MRKQRWWIVQRVKVRWWIDMIDGKRHCKAAYRYDVFKTRREAVEANGGSRKGVVFHWHEWTLETA